MTSPTEDLIAKLSPESEKDFRECFVEDPATGRIRFTTKGLAAYRSQFARAGIDIARIRSREAFRAACEKLQTLTLPAERTDNSAHGTAG